MSPGGVERHHALHVSCRAREERAYAEGFERGAVAALIAAAVIVAGLALLIMGVTGWRPW